MKRIAMPRLRTATAVLASAAGIASLAAVAAPAASAAPQTRMTAHQLHAHHLHHLGHTAGATADRGTATASRSTDRAAIGARALTAATTGGVRGMAQSMVPAGQWASFDAIIRHESSWNPRAVNASSGAYGLGQALPGSKMASAGADWKTNPATQVKWALSYMNGRYGSPNAAWAFWQNHHWY